MVDDPSNRSGDKSGNAAPQHSARSLRGEASIFRPRASSVPPPHSTLRNSGLVSTARSSAPRSSENVLRRFQASSGSTDLTHLDAGWDEEATSIDAGWDAEATSIDAGWDEIGETLERATSEFALPPSQIPEQPPITPGQSVPKPSAKASPTAAAAPVTPPPSISAELTPVPMVVCDRASADEPSRHDADFAPSSVSVAVQEDVIWRGTSAISVGGYSWRREVLPTCGESENITDFGDDANSGHDASSVKDAKPEGSDTSHAEYYPPRPPPSSAAPPEAQPSVCIATDSDPKAQTQPKIARARRLSSPPLLFGLDRMLVWGLVLGGLFVAIIVVIVNQVALIHPRRGSASPLNASSAVSSTAPSLARSVPIAEPASGVLAPQPDRTGPRQSVTMDPDAGLPAPKKPKKPAKARSSTPPAPSFSPTRPILGTD